jgi:hypothetical protein
VALDVALDVAIDVAIDVALVAAGSGSSNRAAVDFVFDLLLNLYRRHNR